jgi:hypothetical protein
MALASPAQNPHDLRSAAEIMQKKFFHDVIGRFATLYRTICTKFEHALLFRRDAC